MPRFKASPATLISMPATSTGTPIDRFPVNVAKLPRIITVHPRKAKTAVPKFVNLSPHCGHLVADLAMVLPQVLHWIVLVAMDSEYHPQGIPAIPNHRKNFTPSAFVTARR